MSAYATKAAALGLSVVLDGVSGSTWQDGTVNSLDATIVGGATVPGPAGGVGDAVRFDGVDDYASIADNAAFRWSDSTTAFTFGCWVRRTGSSPGSYAAFLGAGSTTTDSASVLRQTSVQYGDIESNGSWYIVGRDQGGTLPLNTWTFVAVTFDLTTVRMYVGDLSTAPTLLHSNTNITSQPATDGGFYVGAELYDGTVRRFFPADVAGPFAGLSALSLSELDELYDETFVGSISGSIVTSLGQFSASVAASSLTVSGSKLAGVGLPSGLSAPAYLSSGLSAELYLPFDSSALKFVAATASGEDDVNVAGNVLDDDSDTRWSHDDDPSYLDLELSASVPIGGIEIEQYYPSGAGNDALFDIYTSTDGLTWTKVYGGIATETGLQPYRWPTVTAKYVRYAGLGRLDTPWNSVTRVEPLGETTTTLFVWAPLVTVTAGDTENSIWWEPARPGPAATSWTLEWSTTSSGPWTTLESGITDRYTDLDPYVHTGLTNGTTYYYRVAAVNASGTNAGDVFSGTPTATPVDDGGGLVTHGLDIDATNTGVLAGGGRTFTTSPVTTSSNGQVIENLTIDFNGSSAGTYAITINHDNVTVRNVYVYFGNNSPTNGIYTNGGTTGTLIERCTLNGEKARYGTGRDDANFGNIGIVCDGKVTIRNCRIFDSKQGIQLWTSAANASTVEENWIGPKWQPASGTSNSYISYRGAGTSDWASIRRNRLSGDANVAFMASARATGSGHAEKLYFEDNWIESYSGQSPKTNYGLGGGYQGTYRGSNNNIKINGNRFSGSFRYGTNGAVNVTQTGNTFDNNRMVGSSQDLPPKVGW